MSLTWKVKRCKLDCIYPPNSSSYTMTPTFINISGTVTIIRRDHVVIILKLASHQHSDSTYKIHQFRLHTDVLLRIHSRSRIRVELWLLRLGCPTNYITVQIRVRDSKESDVLRARNRSSFRMAMALTRSRETYKIVPSPSILEV